jgi:GMP synthase (glutamine-hydrolysing)
MILLVDLCYEKDSLSQYEFVHPIAETLKRAGSCVEIQHFADLQEIDLENYDRVILCGTALKDNAYAKRLECFSWIRSFKRPILGICAGMQVIGSLFGGRIIPQPAIGLEEIEIVAGSALLGEPRRIAGYHLHNYAVTLPDDFLLLAGGPERGGRVEAFVHRERPIFGVIFHPEVRNRWILERFAEL